MIGLAGEDHVGIGTDYVTGHRMDAEWWEWAIRDKYHARKLTDVVYETLRYPLDLSGIEHFPNIARNMERRGWPEGRIRKVMGENFFRFLKEVWET